MALLLWPPITWAAPQITRIQFKGLASVSEQSALSRLDSAVGKPYSSKMVREDIKRLYQSGFFSDVRVDKSRYKNGVSLLFDVNEKQIIGKLTLKGNKKLDQDDLIEAISVQEMEPLDPAKVAETKVAIQKLYEEKGYYLVDIESEVVPFDEEANQNELIFHITENKPVKIRRIRFLGNKKYSDKTLRGKIKTKEKGMFSFISGSGKLEEEKLAVDQQMLRFHYMDNGYLKVKVYDPNITLSKNRKAIYVSIPVHEGEQFKVGRVDVAGDILTTKEELLDLLSLEAGEIYKKSLEIQDLQKLEEFYGDQAYAYANIIPSIEMNDDTQVADVTYFIQKGPKIRVDKIIIKGNAVTRDKVIRREMRVVENSFYSKSAIELSKMRLYQLGFFQEVNISTPRGSDENSVNLVVEVVEKSTGTFSIGAGFSTLENFIFTATVQKENFFGRGWSGGVSANISKLRQDIMVSLNDRYFMDTDWFLGVSFQRFQSQLNRDFNQNRFGGTLTLGRELFDFFNLRFGYMIDDVSVTNFSTQVPQFFQDNASGLTSATFASVIYDKRDNRVSTKKGFYSSVGVEWSNEYMGASNEYIKVRTDQRVFIPLPGKFTLKSRAMAGYVNSTSNRPVALFERYFLGGINTLRGYDLNSIGPQISIPSGATGGDTPFTYGGNKMLLFNVELEIPLYAKSGFYGVGFFDSGNSFGENQNIDIRELRSDYGFGLRWQSPFGPLRFEWGFPINKQPGEPGVVFNFSIGQSF